MKKDKYVIGVDYGSDSARAVVVNVENGTVIASAVREFARWKQGLYIDSSIGQYRQHPLDYIEALEGVINDSLNQCPADIRGKVVAIGVDTTGSTPALVNKEGNPLAMMPEFADNPNAMFVLWKDHTAVKEADEINQLCQTWKIDYSEYEGGIYSSEWFWSKALKLMRDDPKVAEAAYSVVECAEWLPAVLTGVKDSSKIVRSRCAHGHKSMWNEAWGGLPSAEFFNAIDPKLNKLRENMFVETFTADVPVGNLSVEWAERLGLSTEVIVSGGVLDCHAGAIGAGIKERILVKAIGTSTCDILVANKELMKDELIQGICGQVDGSVIPGLIGLEAGQSAFGDVYSWFKDILTYPLDSVLEKTELVKDKEQFKEEYVKSIMGLLNEDASALSIDECKLMSLDWFNGRRTPFANPHLKGLISNLTLGTTAPMIFKSLVEATAYGSKAIVDLLQQQKIQIDKIFAVGGIAQKSPLVMQIMADVIDMPIYVCKTKEACALGAAICAAVASAFYESIPEAQEAMCDGYVRKYIPNEKEASIYAVRYAKYQAMGMSYKE